MDAEAGHHPEFLPQLRLDELLAELQGRLQAVLATRDRMRGLLEAVVGNRADRALAGGARPAWPAH
ncbi:MAG TPA: hypothetical protein VGG83_15280 [Trebonia sp.]